MIDLIIRMMLILSPNQTTSTLQPTARAIAMAVDNDEDEEYEAVLLVVLALEGDTFQSTQQFNLPGNRYNSSTPRMWLARQALYRMGLAMRRCGRSATIEHRLGWYRNNRCVADNIARQQVTNLFRIMQTLNVGRQP